MTIIGRRARSDRNLTTGRLTSQILRLGGLSGCEVGLFGLMPLILAYWTGRVSSDALAGVALGTSLYVVLTSICRGISLAGMALLSQCIGSGNREMAERTLMQTLMMLVYSALAVSVLGIFSGRTLLSWMGASGGLLDASYTYLRAIMIGVIAVEALPCVDNLIRGAGFPEYTLAANLITVLTMIFCVPILVLGYGPKPSMATEMII